MNNWISDLSINLPLCNLIGPFSGQKERSFRSNAKETPRKNKILTDTQSRNLILIGTKACTQYAYMWYVVGVAEGETAKRVALVVKECCFRPQRYLQLPAMPN